MTEHLNIFCPQPLRGLSNGCFQPSLKLNLISILKPCLFVVLFGIRKPGNLKTLGFAASSSQTLNASSKSSLQAKQLLLPLQLKLLKRQFTPLPLCLEISLAAVTGSLGMFASSTSTEPHVTVLQHSLRCETHYPSSPCNLVTASGNCFSLPLLSAVTAPFLPCSLPGPGSPKCSSFQA